MARTLWSTRFLAIANDDTSVEVLATPPEGYVWDVRCIDALYNPTITDTYAALCAVQIGFFLLVYWWPMRRGVTYHWEGRQICYFGENLSVTKGPHDGLSVMISGYQLVGP